MPKETAPRRRVVIDSFPESVVRHRGSSALVLVDVLTASTTLTTSLALGRRTFAAPSRDDAGRLAQVLPGAVLAGDAPATRRGSWELPDSPSALTRLGSPDRPLVLFSSPASEILGAALAGGAETYVSSLRNLSATVRALAGRARSVAVIGAGCRSEFSCEDQFACARLAYGLVEAGFELPDPRSMEIVRRWRDAEPSLVAWGNSAAALRRAGRGDDVDFVVEHQDDLLFACRYSRSGELEIETPPPLEPKSPRVVPTKAEETVEERLR